MGVQWRGRRGGTLSQERINRLQSVHFPWNYHDVAWSDTFAALSAYKDTHATWPPRTSVPGRERSLYKWMGTQRESLQRGTLSQTRIDRLNSIGFPLDPKRIQWMEKLDEVREYVETKQQWPESRGALGKWLQYQRQRYREGVLEEYRVSALDAMGMVWEPRSSQEGAEGPIPENGKKGREKEKRERKSSMDSIVPRPPKRRCRDQTSVESGIQRKVDTSSIAIGRPVRACRTMSTKERERDRRQEAGSSDGSSWESSDTERGSDESDFSDTKGDASVVEQGARRQQSKRTWTESFDCLSTFMHTNNGCIPTSDDDPTLHSWTITQRANWKRGALSQDRIDKLDSIGFHWDLTANQWDTAFTRLSEYRSSHSKWPTQSDNTSGSWMVKQRQMRRKGRLSQECIDRLDSISFPWQPLAGIWERHYIDLKRYRSTHNKWPTPSDGTVLNSWMHNQRAARTRLTQVQRDLLDGIGFPWDAISDQWDRVFAEVVAYKEKYGKWPTQTSSPTLGAWVSTQRRFRKRGKVTPAHIAQLDSVDFPWDPKKVAWDRQYAALKEYMRTHITWPRQSYGSLGFWVNAQRVLRRKGKLSKSQEDALDDIGFEWDPRG
ncbi:hypothetical protein KIPB_009962 [Kipferlia bialata]|uniref:Helicase-associated domain-containing protein n=1 Tax=Kipferlia bialata TaxID=797122 RepID=A0A9K3D318_9EUKA|nr:hypothetical protein KIPB_009962 [Kipferlia bialata]|eukprot:g9962.t1